MNNNPIGLFDSGIGGITVLDACRKILPNEDYVYVSDTRNAPYGVKTEAQIYERVKACVMTLLASHCKAIVAACNTATEVAIADMRKEYGDIFVGLEPALKPAREKCPDGVAVLLCTKATSRQPKFRELLSNYGDKNVMVFSDNSLATLIENNIDNIDSLRGKVGEILSQFSDVSCVVLGCTHYVFLRDIINDYYDGSVQIFDGNDGAAKKLFSILEKNKSFCDKTSYGNVKFISL